MRKVCLLNQGSDHSKINSNYIWTKEESVNASEIGKNSKRLKHLCSLKLKTVNFGSSRSEI